MRKAAVLGFKGGTAKSTLAVHAAVSFARSGRKVLLLDADWQGSATHSLGIDPLETPGAWGLFVKGNDVSRVAVKVEDNLDLIPGSPALSTVDAWVVESGAKPRHTILQDRLSSLRGYDVVVIDTAPSFSLLTLNVICYASEAWLPVSLDYLSLQGVRAVLDALDMAKRKHKHAVPIKHVIPMFWHSRRRKDREALDSLKRRFGKAVTAPVRRCAKVSEATSYGKTVFDYARTSTGAEDLRKVTRAML